MITCGYEHEVDSGQVEDAIHNGDFDIVVYEHARDSFGMRLSDPVYEHRIEELLKELDSMWKKIRELRDARLTPGDMDGQKAHYEQLNGLHKKHGDIRRELIRVLNDAKVVSPSPQQ